MDSDVKKQRRRSIRNIRKSSSFVPPAVTYGSAWIGENQETNISNLVKSLEELNCHDGTDNDDDTTSVNIHSGRKVLHSGGDEARDGFSPVISNERVMPCLNGIVYKTFEQNDLPQFRRFELQEPFSFSQYHISSVTKVPDASSEERNVTENVKQVSSDHTFGVQSNFVQNDLDVNVNNRGSQLESASQIFISDNDGLKYSTETEGGVKCDDDRNNFDCSVAVCRDGSFKPLDDTSVDDRYPCESLDQSNMHGEYLDTSRKTLDYSMSPEFSEFCPNSVESTPSIGPMNQAMSSFLNASMGSIFNMSFSPMDDRPDTPKLPSSVQQLVDSHPYKEHNTTDLDRSVSPIISLLDDPVIASDPSTLESILLQNTSSISTLTSIQPSTLPPVTQNTEYNLDSTYTIEESDDTEYVRGEELNIPLQTESHSTENYSLQPALTLSDEQMIMADLEFVKSKRSSKRMSNRFIPMEHTQPCPPLSFEEHSNASLETGDYIMDCVNVDKVDDIADCDRDLCVPSSKFDDSDSNIVNCEVVPSDIVVDALPSSEHNSPAQTTLTDCSNLIQNPAQTKDKKKRRKSNKLALLLEESVRFVVHQSSNDEQGSNEMQLCHNGDKENEDNDSMDAHESQTNDDNSSKRSSRTRRGRKSWDFSKESKAPCDVEASVVKDNDSCALTEFEDLQTVYVKQKYVQESPRPLETIKETSEERNVFLKKRVKRYLEFGSVTQAKKKKRVKKALNIYNGRQCYFPITQQDFDRKMLDVQLLLDS